MGANNKIRKKILSANDVEKLRTQIELQEDDSFFWKTMFDTTLKMGLRVGEVVSLKWKHVDLEEDDLIIEGAKGDKNRTVAIPASFSPTLAELGQGKEGEDYLFPSPKSGHYSKRSFQMRMRDKWSMKAGFYPDHVTPDNIKEEVPKPKRVTPHTLRHTFATRHLKNGAPIEKVSDMLGHSETRTTYKEYSHMVSDDHRQYQDSIDL